MAKILLGVTGSVAAIRTPELFRALSQCGNEARVVATRAALYFFAADQLPPGTLVSDDDEWPRRRSGGRYQRDDEVTHIELRRWADILLIAPLDANSLAKLAYGLADNCLTCVARAWDPARPVVLAPAMNTCMWDHPATRRQLALLFADHGTTAGDGDSLELIERHNRRETALIVIAPQVKRLACGDVGLGAMAEVDQIVSVVRSRLSTPNPG